MRPRIAAGLFLAFVGSVLMPAAAQEPEASSADKALKAAILAEEGERDFERAARLYEDLAQDAKAPAPTRAEAWLRLARLRERRGDGEAARQALQAAAQLDGPAAQEAKDSLGGRPRRIPASMRVKIQQALTKLADPAQRGQAFDELRWIGEPAVPFMIELLDSEPADLELVSTLARVLSTIGGDAVKHYLPRARQSKDVLFRRAFLRGFQGHTDLDRAVLNAFLKDPDAAVRHAAMENRSNRLAVSELGRLLKDQSAEVRGRAAAEVAGRLLGLGSEAPEAQGLMDLLDSILRDPEPRVQQTGAGMMASPHGLRNRAVLDLLLIRLPDPELKEAFNAVNVEGTIGPVETAYVPPAARIAEIAEALGPWSEGRADRRAQVLGRLISASLSSWSANEVEHVLQLVHLGYDRPGDLGPRLSKWMVEMARPEDALGIARALQHFNDGPWVAQRLVELAPGPAAIPPIVEMIRGAAGTQDERQKRLASSGVMVLGAVEGSEGLRKAVELASEHEALYAVAVEAAIRRSDAAALDAVRELMVMEKGSAEHRNICFGTLMSAADSKAIPLYARAYELGLKPATIWKRDQSSQRNQSRSGRGLIWLGWLDRKSPVAYRPEDVATIVAGCLDTGRVDAWRDAPVVYEIAKHPVVWEVLVSRAIGHAPTPETEREFLESLLSVPESHLAQKLEEAVLTVLRGDKEDLKQLVLERWQGRPTPEISRELLDLVKSGNDRLVNVAAGQAAKSPDAAVDGALAELLRSANASMRSLAVDLLGGRDVNTAVEPLVAMMKDPDQSVRVRVAAVARQRSDPRFIPALLDGLRDQDPGVREASQKALTAIEFYQTQKARWERLSKAGGIDGTTAAEALLKQADPKQPKEVRLLAIESLGTLAMPETLPILIGWVGDADPEIARAARAAVQKVNSGGRPKEQSPEGR